MKRWVFWVGIAISVLFLYLALRGLHLPQVWESIRSANLLWLIPAIAVYFIDVFFRACRWQILLRPSRKFNLREVFPMVTIGYFGNNVYPARAGELLRAILLKHRHQIPVSTSLATILIERIFDGVVMLGFIFLNLNEVSGLTSASGFIGSIRSLAFWGALAFIGALVIFFLAAMFPAHVQKLLGRVMNTILPARWRSGALDIIMRFLGGLKTLRTPVELILVFFTSAAVWLLETATYWFVMRAFAFEVSMFALMLMNGILNLSTTLPSAPGYIGTFDAPGIALLAAYGIPSAIAAGYILVLHATLWLPITLVGGFFFARESLDWSRELEGARAERQAPR